MLTNTPFERDDEYYAPTNITHRGGTMVGRRLADGELHPERTEEEDKDDDELDS